MIAELEKRNDNIIAPNDMKQSRTSSIPGRNWEFDLTVINRMCKCLVEIPYEILTH